MAPSGWVLLLGDAAVLAALTALGFARHEEAAAVASPRFLATYVPFLVAWIVAALGTGALDPARAADTRELSRTIVGTLWRPAAAALLAAPIGAVLRGLWLGTPPLPVFVAVMAAVMLVGICLWRGLLLLVVRRRRT